VVEASADEMGEIHAGEGREVDICTVDGVDCRVIVVNWMTLSDVFMVGGVYTACTLIDLISR